MPSGILSALKEKLGFGPKLSGRRVFDPKVRQELKDIRGGGRKAKLQSKSNRRARQEEATAATGGPLPSDLRKRARKGETSIPIG